ncbi:hypothetical protein [Marinibactrum halimedae]|uniref:Transferrin-binding protein B C-lobe/N-lobe beta barrel domain-containing protein n=1 Tax=Marinibactrum halimedae TaxID=1444977 RepID=A0AA37WL21_9GAMM|nr:hypothetical protein [Marinibactrum halimedae]MCD9458750.1 hypothetical protein [Marinibactrum halimedae]GLS25308.1 hypothetical protein GCM10007877_10220 [Marinibactrum halimedae]
MNINSSLLQNLTLAILLSALISCGGGSSSSGGGNDAGGNPPGPTTPSPIIPSPEIFTGKLYPPIDGFYYVSGSEEGITDNGGTFSYEGNQPVAFSIGGINFGSSAGKSILTLVDLTGTDASDIRVQNSYRLLLALDNDGDSTNGILLSEELRAIADNFSQPDFSLEDFDNEVSLILSDAATADNRTPELPSFRDTSEILELSLSCLASGIFSGTFDGDDNGTFLLWVQHQRFDTSIFPVNGIGTGVTSALVYSNIEDIILTVLPREGLTLNTDRLLISGSLDSGAEFSGSFNENFMSLNGRWVNSVTAESGGFEGVRKAGALTAKYRLSGLVNPNNLPFSTDNTSLVGLDIMTDNSVEGVLVTLQGNETILSGRLESDTITATGGRFEFNLNFDADGSDTENDNFLGPVSGYVGTYTDGISGGIISGTSCKIN